MTVGVKSTNRRRGKKNSKMENRERQTERERDNYPTIMSVYLFLIECNFFLQCGESTYVPLVTVKVKLKNNKKKKETALHFACLEWNED